MGLKRVYNKKPKHKARHQYINPKNRRNTKDLTKKRDMEIIRFINKRN